MWQRERSITSNISSLPFFVGTPIATSRSNRPGRRSAESKDSGRLVAAMTTTRSPTSVVVVVVLDDDDDEEEDEEDDDEV